MGESRAAIRLPFFWFVSYSNLWVLLSSLDDVHARTNERHSGSGAKRAKRLRSVQSNLADFVEFVYSSYFVSTKRP